MVSPDAFPAGMLVMGEVAEHHRWGPEIKIVSPASTVTGAVDVIYITDDRPVNGPEDFPPVGSQVEAVVLGYTPHGQLRLSLRWSDVDRARKSNQIGDR